MLTAGQERSSKKNSQRKIEMLKTPALLLIVWFLGCATPILIYDAYYLLTSGANPPSYRQVGDDMNVKAEDDAIVQAGDKSSAESGVGGIAKTGEFGNAKTSVGGVSLTRMNGVAESGPWGFAKTAQDGVATTQSGGISMCEGAGLAESGVYGISIAGTRGSAKSGLGGVLIISSQRDGDVIRRAVEVDGKKIKANKVYTLNEKDEFIEVKIPEVPESFKKK